MNNRPVPVKLLPAGSNRIQLLKDIGEKALLIGGVESHMDFLLGEASNDDRGKCEHEESGPEANDLGQQPPNF